MRIFINTANNLTGGSLQVAISFITECKNFPENTYIVVLGTNIEKEINKQSFPKNFLFYKVESAPFYKLSAKLSKIEKAEKPNVVFTVFGPSYWRPKCKHIMGFANPYYGRKSSYIDGLKLKEKIILRLKQFLHTWYINRDADLIISETNEASEAFKQTFKKVKLFEVVSNNCSNFYWEYKRNHVLKKIPKKEFKLLTLSNYRPNKNMECIPKIIEELHKVNVTDVKFILTINEGIFKEKFSAYKDIINLGPQAANKCPELYEQCDAMFLPTYLECFSASYPEAMIMEKPILTSDLEFAHDICRDAAIFFNPDNPKDIAEKILSLKNSDDLYEALVKKGLDRLQSFPIPIEKTKKILTIIVENSGISNSVLKNSSAAGKQCKG